MDIKDVVIRHGQYIPRTVGSDGSLETSFDSQAGHRWGFGRIMLMHISIYTINKMLFIFLLNLEQVV